MSFYRERYAEVYDLLYADKPYISEAGWVDEVLCKRLGARGSMLELACGTGRHAMEFARLGWTVLATDCSESMLAMAKGRLQGVAGAQVRILDIRNLGEEPPAPAGSCDAVVVLFDSLGYLGDMGDIIRALSATKVILRRGGILICELWHALPMLTGHDPVRIRSLRTPTSEIIRVSETTLQRMDSIATVHYRLIEIHDDGRCETWQETQRNRFFTRTEALLMFQAAGFADMEVCRAYRSSPLAADDWHMAVIAKNTE